MGEGDVMFLVIHARKVAAGLLAVALVGAAAFGISRRGETTEPALETGSWGLSFQTEGEAPIGNATAAQLADYDARFVGDTSEQTIYLTFDAGYENGVTGKILDTLAAHQVQAAFFLTGNFMEQNPDLVRRMNQEGHVVGNHTYHHYDMSKISDQAAFQKELEDLSQLYEEITGEAMQCYYRPPQGIYSEDNLKMAQALGYRTVFWSLAYVDWYNDDQPTAEEAYAKLLPRIHNGAVVLLHATSTTNGEILDDLLTKWEDMGYCFGTMEDLFAAEPG
jgi:peptidoglycan-N-acetylmuramic acid deacetylase